MRTKNSGRKMAAISSELRLGKKGCPGAGEKSSPIRGTPGGNRETLPDQSSEIQKRSSGKLTAGKKSLEGTKSSSPE